MIRWTYFVPRVALFVLFVGLSTLALNPIVRWGIVRTGQSITGAKVDVAKVRFALTKGYVTLDGVRASNPRYPMKNLFQASKLKLNIDTEQLKRRRFVVTSGRAEGFQFGSKRASTGVLEVTARAKYAADLAEEFADTGGSWMQNASQSLTVGVPPNLKSIAMSQQLAEGWPQEQARIDARSTYIRDRIVAIQKLIDSSGENPLRNIRPYQQAIVELETLQKEAFDITGGMNRLRQQLLMDKNAIESARTEDEVFVTQSVQLGSLDGQQLSEYLVGPEIYDQIGQILEWVRWGRKQIPVGAEKSLTRSGRGENLYFSGITPQPQTFLHELAMGGTVDFGGELVPFEGIVRGLTSHPKLSDAPVELEIKTTNGGQLSIKAQLTRSGDQSHDHVLVNYPRFLTDQRTLGDADKLSVSASPGTQQLWVRMEIVDESITGEVVVKQRNVQLTPQLNRSFAGERIAQLVSTSLSEIDRMETRATLSGTIDEPDFQIESSLGPAVASAIAHVTNVAAKEHQRQQLFSTFAEVDAKISQLDLVYQQKNEELVAQFEAGRDQIEQIREIIAMRVDATDGVLDEDSPLRESFRR